MGRKNKSELQAAKLRAAEEKKETEAAKEAALAKAEAEAALMKSAAKKKAAELLTQAKRDAKEAADKIAAEESKARAKAAATKLAKPKAKIAPITVINAKLPTRKEKTSVVEVPIDHPATFAPHVRLGKQTLRFIVNAARKTRDFNLRRVGDYAAQALYFLLVYYRFPGFI